MPQAQNDGILKRPQVLLPAIRKILVGRSPADNRVPVLLLHKIFHLLGSLSSRVETPDESSHAGPGNVVDWDVMLFKPSQNANVRESERASAFEGDADARTLWSWRLFAVRCGRGLRRLGHRSLFSKRGSGEDKDKKDKGDYRSGHCGSP